MQAPSFTVALLCSLGMAAVHVFGHRLRFLEGIPRSRWLSAAGGASVAYVFVHLLPELNEAQEVLSEHGVQRAVAFLDHHIYLLALVGLVAFYGLERAAARSKPRSDRADAEASLEVFWLHMASFALYNLLIGYLLLHRERAGWMALAAYVTAMALHFLVNDHGLRDDHRAVYHRMGRWVLSAAVVSGCVLGVFVQVSEPVLFVLLAFLSGGIVLNVLKEELPEERESRFGAFLLGAAGYVALLMLAG